MKKGRPKKTVPVSVPQEKEIVPVAEKAPVPMSADIIKSLVIDGDLRRLTPVQKVEYYNGLCRSLGLNPLTRPLLYMVLNGKEVLYAARDCAEQLRKINGVAIIDMQSSLVGDIYTVRVKAQDKTGRTDMASGAVNLQGAKGDVLANLYLKAETKAKRRVTLSICGLGVLDETEVETIPGAYKQIDPPHVDPPPQLETTAETINFNVSPRNGKPWTSATDAQLIAAHKDYSRDYQEVIERVLIERGYKWTVEKGFVKEGDAVKGAEKKQRITFAIKPMSIDDENEVYPDDKEFDDPPSKFNEGENK